MGFQGRFFFVFLLACTAAQAGPKTSIEVLSYNLENLFDAKHDAGKADWTFLPKNFPGKEENCKKVPSPYYRKECLDTDWTEPKVQLKIAQLAKVFKERGSLPDIAALIEVENKSIVKELTHAVGFKQFVITESPDARGIDVALAFNPSDKLEYVKHHEIALKGAGFKSHPTRNFLEVEFLVAGEQRLLVYVNHWPSQGAGAPVRVETARQVRARIDSQVAKDPDVAVIALGDFNVIAADKPNPFEPLIAKTAKNGGLIDVDGWFWKKHSRTSAKLRSERPLGTYYYATNNSWNLLDHIFVSSNLADKKGLEVDVDSYEIYAPKLIRHDFKTAHGVPTKYRFDADSAKDAGYSDHFPIAVKLAVP